MMGNNTEKNKNKKIKVMIADDHPAFREGLSRILEGEEDLLIVARAGDGDEAVRMATEFKPDVAIIDVSMPKLNGIEAAEKIKETCPDTAILMVSAYSYQSYLLASLRVGASGYLLKTTPLRELVYAIRMAHAGKAVFDLEAANEVLHRVASDDGQKTVGSEKVYSRELEVLKLVAKGSSNKEIATELAISERTVQTHLVNIFRKLGVGTRTEAVLCALKNGWLSIDDLPWKGKQGTHSDEAGK